jgi:polyisoprenoid-binding protein YceI
MKSTTCFSTDRLSCALQHPDGILARRADGYLIRPVKEIPVTATTPGHQFLPAGLPRLAVGSWRVDPARSYASFAARAVDRPVLGRVPLTGRVLITGPIEDSTARPVARTSTISTGSPLLDRLLAGPGFLDAGTHPEISFRSELLAWVPAGWRAVGRLNVRGTEHELACQLDLHLGGTRPDGSPRILVASSWGHRLELDNQSADPRTRPPRRDDVLIFPSNRTCERPGPRGGRPPRAGVTHVAHPSAPFG